MQVFARKPVNLERFRIPRGRVYLILERCKGCNLCVELCPQQVLEVSPETNAKGYHYPQLKTGAGNHCVNCEFCAMVCPEFAIYTVEVSE
ncbi:MAG: 4Fe-4S dicluster domain-containing protein [Anaerolineales bacterium]|jgi:2-oxoglutarate ferredoxin oxidoreductase subunit delta